MQPSALVEQAAAGDLIADRAAWWPQLQIVLQRIATQGFLCGAGSLRSPLANTSRALTIAWRSSRTSSINTGRPDE